MPDKVDELPVSITSCLEATKQAFSDGGAILDKIKKKRALKRAPPPPRLLEESIDQAPHEIEKEKQQGLARFGKAFQEGDHIAIIQLQQVTIQLQASLLEKLRNAAFDDDHAITDFTYLVDAADGGRDRTVAVLHEFKQRLLHGTSREDFHSPQSSKSDLGVQSPVQGVQSPVQPQSPVPIQTPTTQTPTIQTPSIQSPLQTPPLQTPSAEIPLKSTQSRFERTLSTPIPPQPLQPAPRPGELKKHPTWQRDFNAPNSDDDATSGAEEFQETQRHKKRNSLLHFLKHNRAVSTTDKNVLQNTIAEETPRNGSTSAPLTLRPHPDDATTAARDRSNTNTSFATNNSANSTREARFTYEDWDDDPSETWGPGSRQSFDPENAENLRALHRSSTHSSSARPPSPRATLRTNSMAPSFASFGSAMAAGLGAQHTSATITQPNPDNDFLGFCKSSYKLQNGDRKSSFTAHKQVEPWSRHPGSYAAAPYYLACNAKHCAFRSNFAHMDIDTIWRKVFTCAPKGIKIRWRFLAKSHVLQKVVVKGQYSFKCLFCVFLGTAHGGGGVYHGVDLYLDHINDVHRGQRLNDVVLFKTGCVADRIAEDGEEFDINLWPGSGGSSSPEEKKAGSDPHWLSDDMLFGDPYKERGRDDSVVGANEPWNEGLSDFQYRGPYDRTELE